LKLQTTKEKEGIERALMPVLLCAAAATGSIEKMEGN
jgi:hypothetical protein